MGKPKCFYSVYERGTDRPIYIHGTAEECAKAMGVDTPTFYHYISRARRKSPHALQKFEIVKDDPEEDLDT